MIKYFKLFSLFVIFIVSLNCGSSSGSDGDVGYVLQPGGATAYTTGITSYNIDITAGNQTGAYAVIYNNTVNGIDYVGIAGCADPANLSANSFKIYFQSSSIPNTASFTTSTGNIKVSNGTDYSLSGTANISISGPDDNSVYTITGSGIPLTSGQTLDINSIKAVLVSQ